MAHYAFLDENNVVTDVIVGKNESNFDWEMQYGLFRGQACKRTSYNTCGGLHSNGTPFRKNYAGIGYTYDSTRDAFIPPKRFNSWILNENTCLWDPPKPYPSDEERYRWNEETQTWVPL